MKYDVGRRQREVQLLLHLAKAKSDPSKGDLEKALAHLQSGTPSAIQESAFDLALAASRCKDESLKQEIEKVEKSI